MAEGAWLVQWTETERGWGTRPDGKWFYPSKEAAEKDTKKMTTAMRKSEEESYRGAVPDEYSFAEDPRFVPVKDDLAKEIKEKGRAYRDR